MKSFKQFILEMPHILRNVPNIANRDESDLNQTLRQKGIETKRISSLKTGYSLHTGSAGSGSRGFFVLHNKSKRIKAEILGSEPSPGRFRVHWTARHSSSEIPMTHVYKHLITKHGYEIESDKELSHGSIKTYQKLDQDPELKVTRHDEEGNEIEMHHGDDFHKNFYYGDNSRFRVKKRNSLNESLHDTLVRNRTMTPIYKNPTELEIKKMTDKHHYWRGYVHEGNLYAADGLDATHDDIGQSLGMQYRETAKRGKSLIFDHKSMKIKSSHGQNYDIENDPYFKSSHFKKHFSGFTYHHD